MAHAESARESGWYISFRDFKQFIEANNLQTLGMEEAGPIKGAAKPVSPFQENKQDTSGLLEFDISHSREKKKVLRVSTTHLFP